MYILYSDNKNRLRRELLNRKEYPKNRYHKLPVLSFSDILELFCRLQLQVPEAQQVDVEAKENILSIFLEIEVENSL